MRKFVAVCSAALLLGGIATPALARGIQTSTVDRSGAAPTPEPGFVTDGLNELPPEPRDRYERFNRGVWGFNQFVDRILLKPVSSGYRAVIPRVARRGISRVFNNLSEPWSFVNNLLQAKPGRALNNLGRFVVNTTIGIGGLADHATKLGIAARPEDFGQTLAVWGVRSSAYVVLPVLGPSTIRDGIGTSVAFVADPYQIALNQTDWSVWTKRGIAALSIVSTRADLTESGADQFLLSSLDPYAAARSAFAQRRAAAIANLDSGSGGETNATDSTAADPMTGITAPGAGPVPGSIPAAGTGTEPTAPDAAVPVPDATTPAPDAAPQGTPAASGTPPRPLAAVATPDTVVADPIRLAYNLN